MTTLWQRLATARVGSRDLDADIAEALGWTCQREFRWKVRVVGRGPWYALSHFTTDIDAALYHLPKEWGWSVLVQRRQRPYCTAAIHRLGAARMDTIPTVVAAAEPALALCAAWMKELGQ